MLLFGYVVPVVSVAVVVEGGSRSTGLLAVAVVVSVDVTDYVVVASVIESVVESGVKFAFASALAIVVEFVMVSEVVEVAADQVSSPWILGNHCFGMPTG